MSPKVGDVMMMYDTTQAQQHLCTWHLFDFVNRWGIEEMWDQAEKWEDGGMGNRYENKNIDPVSEMFVLQLLQKAVFWGKPVKRGILLELINIRDFSR